VKRDPHEVIRLERSSEVPRARQVAGVVDEDARTGEEVRGRVGARVRGEHTQAQHGGRERETLH
jgi:hypothetical protein